MKHWAVQVFIAIDQLLNALLRGWADETLSSRAWRMHVKGKPAGRYLRPLIDAVFIWQTWRLDHCQRSYESEIRRYDSPDEMRPPAERTQ